jgi:hypothetical protein
MRTVTLPERTACAVAPTDVLVVGGGPAGMAAAVGAAATGAQVILAERYGFFGGNATAALVMPLMSFHTQQHRVERGPRPLMPDDHGPGEPAIAGVLQTLLHRLVQAGGAIPPSLDTGYVVPFDPEIFKLVALDLLDDAGVHFLLHALATDVVGGANVRGVVLETKSGPLVIEARAVVDCTGDGDLAARAGAPFEIGREEDALVQPMTLMFRMAEFEQAAFQNYVREHPDQWRGVHGLWDLVQRATAAGELDLPREDILMFGTPHEREVCVNSTRVRGVLGNNVWDLSYAEWEGRRQMRQIAAFLQRYVPGFADSYVVQSGVNVGVRETRRILGEYQLTADDVLSARSFPDVIARGTYPLDIHNPAGKGTILTRLPPGQAYEIPLRCLVPLSVENLLVAGRCISGTHEAHSSYRVMPIAMATGHAAGVCAGAGGAIRPVAARNGGRTGPTGIGAPRSRLGPRRTGRVAG